MSPLIRFVAQGSVAVLFLGFLPQPSPTLPTTVLTSGTTSSLVRMNRSQMSLVLAAA